jgi:hypothetical protein
LAAPRYKDSFVRPIYSDLADNAVTENERITDDKPTSRY